MLCHLQAGLQPPCLSILAHEPEPLIAHLPTMCCAVRTPCLRQWRGSPAGQASLMVQWPWQARCLRMVRGRIPLWQCTRWGYSKDTFVAVNTGLA